MNESVTWPLESSSNIAGKATFVGRNTLLFALLGLLLGLAFSIWMYFQGQNPLLSLATLGTASILSVSIFSILSALLYAET